MSYAAAATKNVAQSFPPPSEQYPDDLGVKKTNLISRAVFSSTKPIAKGINGNIDNGMNSTTEDFPPIEGQMPSNRFIIKLKYKNNNRSV